MTRLTPNDLCEIAFYCEKSAARARNSAKQACDDQLMQSFNEQADEYARYANGLRELAATYTPWPTSRTPEQFV